MEIENVELKEKDIVWAKVKGYQWWPGIIKNIIHEPNQNNYKGISNNKKFIIDFIGNESQGEVAKNDIKSFKHNYEEHSKTKNPSLIKSIELANELYQEKSNNEIFYTSNGADNIKSKKQFIKKKKEIGENTFFLLNKKRKKEEKKKNLIRNNDIKINININVTNNNQRTVNINSFSNYKEKKEKRKNYNKKKEDEEYIFEEEEEENDDNEDENEDLNDIDFDEESLENELNDINIRNYKTYNKKVNKYNNYSKLKINKINEKNDINKEKNILKNEELNKIIEKLINYQIQLSNSINQRLIIEELNNLQIIIQNDNNINYYYKELFKILSTFTYNKNIDIVLKSTDILSNLTHIIIKDIFLLSDEDKSKILNEKNNKKIKYLKEIKLNSENENDDKDYLESKRLSDMITNNKDNKLENNFNFKKSKIKKIINNNNEQFNNNSNNNNKNDEIILSLNKNNNDDNFTDFTDKIINIVINDLKDNFYNLSENFFKNIYNKNNNGLNKNLAIKRKYLCIKLFSLFKKVFPKLNEEYIKKIILFFEYKIRIEDPSLGKKYTKEIIDLFYKIKNINNEKSKE